MATRTVAVESIVQRNDIANGGAMASFLGAGLGSFSMGLFVLLNEAGLFAAPTLYGPAGGVSGRTTLAVLVWLMAWGVLHLRWRSREIPFRRVCLPTLVLVGSGILATFPPLWRIF
jgi:hypothetical protein